MKEYTVSCTGKYSRAIGLGEKTDVIADYVVKAQSNNEAVKIARRRLWKDEPTAASGFDFGPVKYQAKILS